MPDYLRTQNKFVLVNNIKIAYRELGATTFDLPLLLLNHLGATMDEWDSVFINELTWQNHVIVVDLNDIDASKLQLLKWLKKRSVLFSL